MTQNVGTVGLEAFAENVWLLDGVRVHMDSILFETRSVLLRLTDGSIWDHSAVGLTVRRHHA